MSSPTRKKKHVLRGAVHLVGTGPSDPSLLTVRAAELIAAADLVVGHGEHHAAALALRRAEAEYVDTATGEHTDAELAKLLTRAAKEGRTAVRLYTGDPFLGCAGAELGAACTKAGVAWDLVPGISSALAVPAHAGVALTGRKHHAVTLVDVSDESYTPDWPALAAGTATLVFLGAERRLAKIATALVEHGRRQDTPVAVTVNGTSTDQHTVVATLETVEAEAAEILAAGPAVLIVGDAVAGRDKLSWFESKPLFGWRVLVPRTKEQAGALSAQLRSYGAVPVEVPTIAVEPPRTPAQMDRAVKGLFAGRYQWVVFTSTNAVRAIVEKFEEYGLDARAMAGVKVAAVGEQTAARLREFGIRPELVPSGQQSGEGLLADFPPYDDVLDPINRIFLPRADIATETLVAGLTARGWECEDVTAYRTVRAAPPPAEIRDAIKSGGFDAVLFTSSSTVRNLVGIAGKPHASTVIAVIGPQTAATAEELGLRVDVRSAEPSVSLLAEALADFAVEQREVAAAAPAKGRKAPARARRAT